MILIEDIKMKNFDGDVCKVFENIEYDILFNPEKPVNKKTPEKIYKGERYYYIDRYGNKEEIVVALGDNVYNYLNLPLQFLENNIHDLYRIDQLKKENKKLKKEKAYAWERVGEYQNECLRLENNYNVVINKLNDIRNMSFWSKLKFLFVGNKRS